jgi:hypothetical protein
MADRPPSAARLAELKARVTARLQPVCAGWPEERFRALVESVALITLKYELIGAAPPGEKYDRRTTERLIADLKKIARRSAEVRESEE